MAMIPAKSKPRVSPQARAAILPKGHLALAESVAARLEPARNHEWIPMRPETDLKLRQILEEVLGLKPGQVDGFTADTGLFGELPELDSMAVAGLLTEMEDRLGITIDEDEIDGEIFETYGSLLKFAVAKQEAA
jgi:acyl carrier protein